jgi:predicted DNA-binding transcriptional regulator AlpA
VNQPEAQRYCGVSRSQWFRLRSAGHAPKPVRMPGSSRPWWRVRDLDRWLAGLPTKKN